MPSRVITQADLDRQYWNTRPDGGVQIERPPMQVPPGMRYDAGMENDRSIDDLLDEAKRTLKFVGFDERQWNNGIDHEVIDDKNARNAQARAEAGSSYTEPVLRALDIASIPASLIPNPLTPAASAWGMARGVQQTVEDPNALNIGMTVAGMLPLVRGFKNANGLAREAELVQAARARGVAEEAGSRAWTAGRGPSAAGMEPFSASVGPRPNKPIVMPKPFDGPPGGGANAMSGFSGNVGARPNRFNTIKMPSGQPTGAPTNNLTPSLSGIEEAFGRSTGTPNGSIDALVHRIENMHGPQETGEGLLARVSKRGLTSDPEFDQRLVEQSMEREAARGVPNNPEAQALERDRRAIEAADRRQTPRDQNDRRKPPMGSRLHPAQTTGGQYGFPDLPELTEDELVRMQNGWKKMGF